MRQFIVKSFHIIILGGAVVAFLLLFHSGTQHTCCNVGMSDTIVNVLSILVTILLGWNIYSAIGVEQKIKDIQSLQTEHAQQLDKKINMFEANVSNRIDKIEEELEGYKQAYISLFNTTQGQFSVIMREKEYLQQYSYFQTALNALLQCKNFPSDIRYNIRVLLDMMEETLNKIPDDEKIIEHVYYTMNNEDRKEFLKNLDEICKSSREEFSFEDRKRFIKIATKAKGFLERQI